MIPESVARVFTKYDSVPDEIEVEIPIPDIRTADLSVIDCYFGLPYRRYAMNAGVEGVMFVYYQKVDVGGFIGEIEGTVHWQSKGEKNDKVLSEHEQHNHIRGAKVGLALRLAHALGEGQAHLAAEDKGEAMRAGKVRALIFRDSVDLYLLSNGRTPQFFGLLQGLSRIETFVGLFHLITKSGNCIWVDEIQKGISNPREGSSIETNQS